MTAVVELKNVMFRRQRRTILADVNLCVQPGEKWIIFGPNGIGKSTLISMMATRLFPSEGTVGILGNRLGKVNVFSYRHRIGLASGALNRAFDPLDDPLDAIVSALDSKIGRRGEHYSTEQYAAARELMRHYGIEYLAGKKMFKLSEGERTRVGICRALMTNPDLLILDEPTAGLDLGGRELVVHALANLATEESERSALLVTHRLEEIPEGFNKIAILGHVSQSRADDIAAHVLESEEAPADGSAIINPRPGSILFTGSLEEGLTSERLSNLFELPVRVVHEQGRWSAFAR